MAKTSILNHENIVKNSKMESEISHKYQNVERTGVVVIEPINQSSSEIKSKEDSQK